jgi:hypothetical protein
LPKGNRNLLNARVNAASSGMNHAGRILRAACRLKGALLAGWVLMSTTDVITAVTNTPAFPLTVAPSGRHLQDQLGQPFFFQADYVLEILTHLTPAQTLEYLDTRQQQGFTAIRAFLQPPGILHTNRLGFRAFDPPGDLSKPVQGWFDHAAWFAREAGRRGMLVAFDSLFFGCCAQSEHYWSPYLTPANARAYGRFLGNHFKNNPNILWIHGGDQDPAEWLPQLRDLLEALRSTGAPHLQTLHPAINGGRMYGAPAHSGELETWLDLRCVFVHRPSYPDFHRRWNLAPAKPAILSESFFEKDEGFGYTPLRLRQLIYWSYLGGGAGHTYGNAAVWSFPSSWRKDLDTAGTRELQYAQTLLRPRWQLLEPDQHETLITRGAGFYGDTRYALAAFATDRSFALAYLPPDFRQLTFNLATLPGPGIRATWFNPRNGTSLPPTLLKATEVTLSPPDPEDWVLLLEGGVQP